MPGKPKVLFVDDKVDNLRIRAMLLAQFGCDTVLASDHNSALRARRALLIWLCSTTTSREGKRETTLPATCA